MNPTTAHMEGFFHGAAHMIEIANQNKRGETSTQVLAMRTERTKLLLLSEAKQLNECKAWAHRSSTIISGLTAPLIKPLPLMKNVLAGVLMLCILFGLSLLFLRAVVIEGDMRTEKNCKYYSAEMNAAAIKNGELPPCN